MNTKSKCQFASDNYAGICSAAWEAMENANHGFKLSYGEDEWTKKASDNLRQLFNHDCEIFFVFNGTAANSLALAQLCHSYHSVICSNVSHIETDECGGPEFFTHGTKILIADHINGKLDPVSAEKVITRRSDIHFSKPKVISITQSTELGTVYAIEELKKIQALKEKYHLKLHMDGARFANAVASLNVSPSEITWKVGVDVLCFGGTKNGMAVGEAVIFFNRELADEFDYRCKQSGQLSSKMRFLSSPWLKMLETGEWLTNAQRANQQAVKLAEKLSQINALKIAYPCEANAVFVTMPLNLYHQLIQKGWHFYNFIGGDLYRLMCSWDIQDEDIDNLIKDIKTLVK